MDGIRDDLMEVVKNAPFNGHVTSDNYAIIRIKERWNKSDYYIVEVLEDMMRKKMIKELDVRYDNRNGHLLSYSFK